MGTAKKLALIGAGYALSVGGGLAAVALNELRIAVEDAQASSGMVAAPGGLVLFFSGHGVLGLVPTWFLLKLAVENAPRALLATELLIAALGPASWLAVTNLRSAVSALQKTPWASLIFRASR